MFLIISINKYYFNLPYRRKLLFDNSLDEKHVILEDLQMYQFVCAAEDPEIF